MSSLSGLTHAFIACGFLRPQSLVPAVACQVRPGQEAHPSGASRCRSFWVSTCKGRCRKLTLAEMEQWRQLVLAVGQSMKAATAVFWVRPVISQLSLVALCRHTLGGVYYAEYDASPAGPFREVRFCGTERSLLHGSMPVGLVGLHSTLKCRNLQHFPTCKASVNDCSRLRCCDVSCSTSSSHSRF